MKILFLKENKNKKNIALMPSDVIKIPHDVYVEKKYGKHLSILDKDYSKVNATICSWKKVIHKMDIIVKLSPLTNSQLKLINPKQLVISNPYLVNNPKYLLKLLKKRTMMLGMEVFYENKTSLYLSKNEKLKADFAIYEGSFLQNKYLNKKFKELKHDRKFDKNLNYVILNYSYCAYFILEHVLQQGGKCTLLESNKILHDSIKNSNKLRSIEINNGGKLDVKDCSFDTLVKECKDAHVLINTTYLPSEKTHLRITSDMVSSMPKGSVFIDCAAEQGFGCEIISKPSTIKKPVIRYKNTLCLAFEDIPNIFPRDSSLYLSEVITKILNRFDDAVHNCIVKNESIKNAILTINGKVVNQKICESLNIQKGNVL